jgi:hypothetical protein
VIIVAILSLWIDIQHPDKIEPHPEVMPLPSSSLHPPLQEHTRVFLSSSEEYTASELLVESPVESTPATVKVRQRHFTASHPPSFPWSASRPEPTREAITAAPKKVEPLDTAYPEPRDSITSSLDAMVSEEGIGKRKDGAARKDEEAKGQDQEPARHDGKGRENGNEEKVEPDEEEEEELESENIDDKSLDGLIVVTETRIVTVTKTVTVTWKASSTPSHRKGQSKVNRNKN